MLKFWINLIVIVVIASFGLAIGSANDSTVFFDFLIIKADVSLATVLVVGVILGFILGLLGSLLLILKYWNRARSARSSLSKMRKEELRKEQASKKEQETLPTTHS
ncbi:MAG: lipopolysaccharide assembly protein LapA domain-containing protein [Succinatimonas sp.]|nr:lipopolysaccharide assembly protein LapA domain-containing protein [Succinatimonas sp.]